MIADPKSARLRYFIVAGRHPAWSQAICAAFFGSLGATLLNSSLNGLEAWQEVLGTSRLISALIVINGFYLLAGVAAYPTVQRLGFITAGVLAGAFMPMSLPTCAVISSAAWLAAGRHPAALTTTALAALGAYAFLLTGDAAALMNQVLQAEALIVATIIEVLGRAVDLHEAVLVVEEGISIRLVKFCSSVWPLLTVTAGISTFLPLFSKTTTIRALAIAICGALTIATVNWARLAIMASGQEAYHWFHDGAGSVVVRLLAIAAITVAVAWAVLDSDDVR